MGLETRASELSPRARICRAALRSFAERGFASTSIRAVAAEAGVSAGLVQHYFRTKRDLAAAVEELAIGRLGEVLSAVPMEGEPYEVAEAISRAVGAFGLANPDVIAYARRSILEAGSFGDTVVRTVASLAGLLTQRLAAAGLLRDDVDPTWVHAGALVIATGPYLLQPWLEEVAGHPVSSAEFMEGWGALWTGIVSRGVFRTEESS
jgi:AcrR family transcriptional regulator